MDPKSGPGLLWQAALKRLEQRLKYVEVLGLLFEIPESHATCLLAVQMCESAG